MVGLKALGFRLVVLTFSESGWFWGLGVVGSQLTLTYPFWVYEKLRLASGMLRD